MLSVHNVDPWWILPSKELDNLTLHEFLASEKDFSRIERILLLKHPFLVDYTDDLDLMLCGPTDWRPKKDDQLPSNDQNPSDS